MISPVIAAEPAAFLGITYSLDGNFGLTAKVLSEREEDKAIVGVGLNYYPNAEKKIGVDLSGGYNFDNSAALFGYDFLQKSTVIGFGWTNTQNSNNETNSHVDSEIVDKSSRPSRPIILSKPDPEAY